MGWLIALAVLSALILLPIGAGVFYNSEGLLVKLIAGPVRMTLYPVKKKGKERKKKEKKAPKKEKTASKSKDKTPKKQENGGSITDFLPLVQTALAFLNGFRRKLRVNKLEVKLILGGGDPCDLAVNYGRTWAAVGNLMPQLERVLAIQKREINVECDFTAAQTLVIARVDLTITLGRILWLVLRYGIQIAIDYFKIMNKRKGGVKQ